MREIASMSGPLKTTDATTERAADLVFLDLKAVKALIGGASTSAIYADPTFPPRVRISPGKVRWIRHEIVAWMRAKIAQRDAVAEQRRQELLERQERRRAKQRTTRAA
jgi:predicted DNA-binding transcriptional regulator AlpA